MNKTVLAVITALVIFSVFIPAVITVGDRILAYSGKIISPLPDNYIPPVFTPTPSPAKKISLPKDAVNNYLSDKNIKYGLVIKNLDTGETLTENSDIQFPAASLYKLWVMAAVYNDIKNGDLSADQKLTQSIPVLNRKFNIDSESAELTEVCEVAS